MSPAPSLEAAMGRLDLLKRSGVEEATQASSGGDSGGGPGSSSQSTSTTKLKGAVTIPEHRVKRFHKLLSDAVVGAGEGDRRRAALLRSGLCARAAV